MKLSALYRLAVLSAALGLSLAGCGGGGDDDDLDITARADSYSVKLPYRQSVFVQPESMTLTLDAVRDSRCPTLAQCVAQGAAEADVAVSLPGIVPGPTVLTFAVRPASHAPASLDLRGYRFTLVALETVPPSTTAPVQSYRAQVTVDRLEH